MASLASVSEIRSTDRRSFSLSKGITLDLRKGSRELELGFLADNELLATARIPFNEPIDELDIQQSPHGLSLRVALPPVADKTRRWAIRLLPVAGEAMVQIVEVSSIVAGAWTIDFTGPIAHVQRQGEFTTSPTDGQQFPFGGFTQHGQICNLKDWFFVERDGVCSGLLALRPGTWTHPASTFVDAIGHGDTLQLTFKHGSPRVRRSFLLARAPAEQVLARQKTGHKGFEPADGYARWPALQIARFGFARRERLDAYARSSTAMTLPRPAHFAFGDDQALARAIDRATAEPELLANPLWAGDFEKAKAWMFKSLRQMDSILRDSAYLHPLGNPVAGRVLGPAAGLFHMLDFLGHLTDAERTDAAHLIATLAELLHRRDFYPHDFAAKSPEYPYTADSKYRGMLNQNFNTDRFVFVGLAGCVLPSHPHARRWRLHAIEQFESQMRAYVYPGGCWEESHTYANHVKMTLLPLVLALRHVPGDCVDLMKNENFIATCRFFIPLLSPPEATSHRRLVPAVGDHHLGKHDDFSCILGWLAELCPDHRDEFLWAWREQGSTVGERTSMQATTFSPLMLPAREAPTPKAPALPTNNSLPGYGAYIRREFQTPSESLLVVRCGPAWGHYHNDQGSFWWWVKNRLIACDAGFGDGPLKFAHHGHNVPGYVGREPKQWLDQQPFAIDRYESLADGSANIRCQIPTSQWMDAFAPEDQIPPAVRPHVTRSFEWRDLAHLRITDTFLRSPNGQATFSLHIAARNARRTGPTEITFDLLAGTARLTLPLKPDDVQFHHSKGTCGVTCTYAEGTLSHDLQIE